MTNNLRLYYFGCAIIIRVIRIPEGSVGCSHAFKQLSNPYTKQATENYFCTVHNHTADRLFISSHFITHPLGETHHNTPYNPGTDMYFYNVIIIFHCMVYICQ